MVHPQMEAVAGPAREQTPAANANDLALAKRERRDQMKQILLQKQQEAIEKSVGHAYYDEFVTYGMRSVFTNCEVNPKPSKRKREGECELG